MSQHDLETRKIERDMSLLRPSEHQDLQGRASSLSNCCPASPDRIARFQKHWQDSNQEIKSGKAANSLEVLNYGNSSTNCTNQDADDLRKLSSVVSTERDSIFMNENSDGGTPMVISPCKMVDCERNFKDGDVSSLSPRRMDSTRNTSISSDASSETREAINNQNKGRGLNAGEDGLTSMVKDTYHSKLLKTESSSSNSTLVMLPASSNDSNQEGDVKSSKCSQSSGTDAFMCIDLKRNLEGHVAKVSALDSATNVSPAVVSDTVFLPGKQGNVRISCNCDKQPEMIAGHKSLASKMDDVPKSNLPKLENANISNLGKVESCYELDDALEVARRVAMEVALEVGAYRDTSRNSFCGTGSSETVHLNSAGPLVPYKENFISESKCEVTCEQKNDGSFCSSKKVVEGELSLGKKQLYFDVAEFSQDLVPPMMTEPAHKEELSNLIKKSEGLGSNDQTIRSSSFDLNEDIVGNDAECSKPLVNEAFYYHAHTVSKPTPVMAKSGIPIYLPVAEFQLQNLGGWRGPAATSAFRPAFVSESSDKIKELCTNNDSCSKDSRFKGIDLNIAAAGVDSDMELLPEKCNPTLPSFHSEDSSVGVGSTRAERFNIDLNCSNEDDNCAQISAPVSSASLSVRNFDLNDNPTSQDAYVDAYQPVHPDFALRCRLDDPEVSFVGNARQQEYNNLGSACWSSRNPVQVFNHGHARPFLVAVPSMISTVEQMPRPVPLQDNPSYKPIPRPQPALAFPYSSGYCTEPLNGLSSTVYSSACIPYMTNQNGPPVFLQVLGSGNLPGYPGALQYMQVPGAQRPTCLARENGSVEENGGQRFTPVNNLVMEEPMKFFQPVALKRREPEGGWESHQHGYRQVASRR